MEKTNSGARAMRSGFLAALALGFASVGCDYIGGLGGLEFGKGLHQDCESFSSDSDEVISLPEDQDIVTMGRMGISPGGYVLLRDDFMNDFLVLSPNGQYLRRASGAFSYFLECDGVECVALVSGNPGGEGLTRSLYSLLDGSLKDESSLAALESWPEGEVLFYSHWQDDGRALLVSHSGMAFELLDDGHEITLVGASTTSLFKSPLLSDWSLEYQSGQIAVFAAACAPEGGTWVIAAYMGEYDNPPADMEKGSYLIKLDDGLGVASVERLGPLFLWAKDLQPGPDGGYYFVRRNSPYVFYLNSSGRPCAKALLDCAETTEWGTTYHQISAAAIRPTQGGFLLAYTVGDYWDLRRLASFEFAP